MYKLPRDNWIREFENAQATALKEQKAAAEVAEKQVRCRHGDGENEEFGNIVFEKLNTYSSLQCRYLEVLGLMLKASGT